MPIPTFQKGQPVLAKDLNALAQAVVRLLNITANGGIAVTKNSNGFSLRGDTSRVAMHGKVLKDLPFGKAGVVEVYQPDTTASSLDSPQADSEPEDGPEESATGIYEWVVNWCLEGGKKITEDSRVICVRDSGWWYIVAVVPCPEDE